MNPRVKKLRFSFAPSGIDAFLVTKDINISYLTTFPASESWLLVCPHEVFYLTDFRYVLEAKKGLKGVTVIQYQKSIDEAFAQITRRLGVRRVGIDARHLSLFQFESLKKKSPPSLNLVRTDQLVERLRELKEPQEVKKIRQALAVHKQMHAFLKRILKPGLSENEILMRLEEFIRMRGVKFSFDPIVAGGTNACYPHAKVTQRKIRRDDVVLVDVGIDQNGYKSDLTRMFFLGRIPPLVRETDAVVAAAQRKAIEKIAPGVPISQIDRAARNYLAEHKLAQYFGHALGHGVGLEIHENPRLSADNPFLLREGMVITVEPAVYIPRQFGIRIEDMVLVTKKGCEVLSDDIH